MASSIAIHHVRTSLQMAVGHSVNGEDEEALARLESATHEADAAIARIGDAYDPASLVLTTARHGADVARNAFIAGNEDEALGALRAVLAGLDNVPAIIRSSADEGGRA